MSKGDNMFIKLRWKDALREILVETGQRKGAGYDRKQWGNILNNNTRGELTPTPSCRMEP